MSEGEEKTEQPTDQKLRKAREEGQLASRKDFITAAVGASLFIYALFFGGRIVASIAAATDAVLDNQDRPLAEALERVLGILQSAFLAAVLPICVVALLCAVVLTVLMNGGFMVVMKPLVPDLKRINPASGFKNLFGEKAWIEIAKSLLLLVALGAALAFTLLGSLRDMLLIPYCGFECIADSVFAISRPLIFVAIGIGLLAGAFDLPLQQYLFIKEQKMSKTELKREMKEDSGDPELMMERKRLQHEAVEAPKKLGLRYATFVMAHDGQAVAMRYVDGETPIPMVVARGRTRDMGEKLVDGARARGIPVVADAHAPVLAGALAPGKFIREQDFPPVIAVMRAARIL
jgi:type III secretion protein U